MVLQAMILQQTAAARAGVGAAAPAADGAGAPQALTYDPAAADGAGGTN
jgi:hypothetical protein